MQASKERSSEGLWLGLGLGLGLWLGKRGYGDGIPTLKMMIIFMKLSISSWYIYNKDLYILTT